MPKGKAKTFADHLNERLDQAEILRLENAARLEQEYFSDLKKELNQAITAYANKKGISFYKLARLLCCSESQALRIIGGEHGFTMATIARIGAAIGIKPHITFEDS